jgi:hypothetical protein
MEALASEIYLLVFDRPPKPLAKPLQVAWGALSFLILKDDSLAELSYWIP